ncbi:MAG: hypothetical protein KJ884_00885 [Gammaproteobacteria bacterium]|nr:hypothetical protein [Gammaproteobacteria bacterium]MBU1489396.1 hypothetical protein [Gammaproteobacteria bacterium]MBU2065211.1 hypothetical protein [Gammaproteobacteria bacterium]MBU2141092.1 hypothetical protein [Gammaproteobacteria bacterium]MBU2215315.1 hypothetical protein [Gammaproteobacteria bacterium]
MNRFLSTRGWNALTVLMISVLLTSCISVPTGTTKIYRKADAEKSAGPQTDKAPDQVVFDKTLFRNSIDPKLTIRKSGADKTGADVFAIYLSDGYFKYLKDMGGVNEVVVVAEFTETSAGTESDTVYRVLGPYFGVADKAGAPFLNKLLYGPKTLDSDHLNMRLTVLEYDQGENENSAAFLDFIQSVTQTLSLANPVTVSEQAFATEIAKSLISLNKDDVVMTIDINFTGNAGELESMTHNGSYIPLNVGDYVLINKEQCAPANCYFQMTDKKRTWNPFAWIGDIVMLVPTAMRRGWTDTPDGPALAEVVSDDLGYANHRLTVEDTSPLNSGHKPFTDKTWLALSIVKGGDASLWEKRKLLTQAEISIQNMIKVRGGPLAFNQNFQTAKQALDDVSKAEALSRSGVTFVLPLATNGAFAPTTGTADDEYCLYHSSSLSDVVASFYRIDANNIPQQLAATDIVKNTAKTTPNNTCFTVTAAARTVGTYDMLAAYKVGGNVLTQKLRYKIEK